MGRSENGEDSVRPDHPGISPRRGGIVIQSQSLFTGNAAVFRGSMKGKIMITRKASALTSSLIAVVGLGLVGYAGYSAVCGNCSASKNASAIPVAAETSCCSEKVAGCCESEAAATTMAVSTETVSGCAEAKACSESKTECTGGSVCPITGAAMPVSAETKSEWTEGKTGCESTCPESKKTEGEQTASTGG